MNEEPPLLTMAQLKARGWTPTLVKKFLGSPDATKPNPHYRSAAPMQLYSLARVEVVEQEDTWKQAATSAAARSTVGKTVATRKAAELVAQAEQLAVTVIRLPLDKLLKNAIDSYNAFHEELLWERGHDYEPATEQSDPAFLDRITVNYIRHNLTEYDSHLEELAGRIGVREAGKVIRNKIYAAIAAQYPEYAEECKRQMQLRNGEIYPYGFSIPPQR